MLLCLLAPLGAHAESANKLARKAQDLYRQQRFQDAAEAYRDALAINPSSRLLQYNLGTALSREGQADDATSVLSQAAQAPGGHQTDAFYNLGVTLAESAQPESPQAAPPSQPEQTQETLNQSLQALRQAILTSPAGSNKRQEAVYNYEVVKQRLEELKQQQQQQQQGSDQSQDQNQNGENESDSQSEQGNQNQSQNPRDDSNSPQDGETGEQQQSDDPGQQSQSNEGQHDPQSDQEESSSESQNPEDSQKEEDSPQRTPQGNQPEDRDGRDGDQPQPRTTSGGSQDESLTPGQMDALQVLNLLESEKPEQFKDLFRYEGQIRNPKSGQDW